MKKLSSSAREVLAATGILLALALIVYGRGLVPGRVFIADVLFTYFLGPYSLVRQAIAQGELPFWNPYLSGGIPFLANPLSCLFYPATYFFVLWSFATALKVHIVFHAVLAGVSMFLLARKLGLTFYGTLLSGIVYALNGFAVLHHSLPPTIQVYALTPLVVYLVRRALSEKSARVRAASVIGLALVYFGGYPPFIIYAGILIATFVGVLDASPWQSRAVQLGLLGAASLALAAIQLGPTLEFSLQSSRAAGFSLEEMLAKSLEWKEIFQMLFYPLWSWYLHVGFDVGIAGFYWGYGVLALSLLALYRTRTSRLSITLGVLAVIGLILAAGKQGGIYPILAAHVWPFTWLRYPSNSLILTSFAIALLAGLGLSSLGKRAALIGIALCSLDLVVFAQRAYETLPSSFYSEVPPTAVFLQKNLHNQRILMTPPTAKWLQRGGNTRYEAYVNFADSIIPNYATVFRLWDAGGTSAVQYGRYQNVQEQIAQSARSPWLDLLAVRYLLSFWDIPGLKSVWQGPSHIQIFERPSALPRAYFIRQAIYRNPEAALTQISSGVLDPRRAVVIQEPVVPETAEKQVDVLRPLTVENLSPNRLRIHVETSEPGWVVLTDSYDPGWRVRNNGQAMSLYRANYLQQAVPIEAGHAVLDWRYRPSSWLWAPLVTLLAIGWILYRLACRRLPTPNLTPRAPLRGRTRLE